MSIELRQIPVKHRLVMPRKGYEVMGESTEIKMVVTGYKLQVKCQVNDQIGSGMQRYEWRDIQISDSTQTTNEKTN